MDGFLARQKDAEIDQLFTRARVYLQDGQNEQACRLLETAAALKPDSAGIHCNLGLALENAGQLEKAISQFERALELSPLMPEATINLAGCYQSLGETGQAIAAYKKYLRLSPQEQDRRQVKDIITALERAETGAGADAQLGDYFDSIARDGALHWSVDKLPIKIYVEDGRDVRGYRPSFPKLLIESLDAWVAASGNRLSYVEVPLSSQADVICQWVGSPEAVPEAFTQSERGVTALRCQEGIIYGGTLRILTTPILKDGVLSDDTIKKACLHETGHMLGLNGHSTNIHDIMFITIDSPALGTCLSKRDTATILRLYNHFPPFPESKTASPGGSH